MMIERYYVKPTEHRSFSVVDRMDNSVDAIFSAKQYADTWCSLMNQNSYIVDQPVDKSEESESNGY